MAPPPPHRRGPYAKPAIINWDDHPAQANIAAALENDYGILTRPGLHCAPLIHAALGTTSCGGTTRLSFGPFLSKQDVKYATDALAEIAAARVPAGRA